METVDVIRVVPCNSVQNIFEILSLSNPIWKGHAQDSWAFRGQRDASWGLLPRVFRLGECLSYSDSEIQGPMEDYSDQINREGEMLKAFIHHANKVGLPLPEEGPDLLDEKVWRDSVTRHVLVSTWPLPIHLPYLAVAQHHGLPTRLLDFSFRPHHALFFAAHDAYLHEKSQPDPVDVMAVWGIDLKFIELGSSLFTGFSLDTVMVRKHSNPFLRAQDGLFIYQPNVPQAKDSPLRDFENNIASEFKDLDEYEVGSFNPDVQEKLKELKRRRPAVVKIEVPTSLVKDVLWELSRHQVTLASLMPSYDYVVKWLEFSRDCFRTGGDG